MDFGLVGLDGLVSSNQTLGSEFHKQERSFGVTENDWRCLKKSRTDEYSTMLSFSSPKSDPFLLNSDYYHSAYTTHPGLGAGSLNANINMHGGLLGTRGPFTPSQWMELEHQALIYKYINANVPIPSNLLIPIRRALNPSGFSAFSCSFRPNTLGWGSFHLGFAGSNDPEPGRCRRTDGKKWRCSRDAVADQKYCERHMNRGRHRSRKPVEGQTGHAAAGQATAKVMPMASPTPALVASGGGISNNLNAGQHQITSLRPDAADTSSDSQMKRISLNNGSAGGRLQDSHSLSMLPQAIKSKHTPFSALKQQFPGKESYRSEFGLLQSASLLNSTSQRSSYMDCSNFSTSTDLNNQEPRAQDPLCHFIDDWPKNQSDSSKMAWPEVEETQLDRTQLSISMPLSSEFSSSSSSPIHKALALSPLRLSREFGPVEMGLGVGSLPNEPTQRQVNWIPISWESSMGGPLGEVLNRTNSSSGNHKNASSALNLMTEGWDNCLQIELSPTGVLHKTSFGSLSNSSTGSSPRAETNKNSEGGNCCEDMQGPTFANSSSITSL